jgi:hypothetical protein
LVQYRQEDQEEIICIPTLAVFGRSHSEAFSVRLVNDPL